MESRTPVSATSDQTSSGACGLFRRCIELQRREDWQTFAELYRQRVTKTVYRALRRMGDWPFIEDPEEITQELYCRLLDGGARHFRGHSEGELWAYLGQVTFRLLIDRSRRQMTVKRRIPRTRADIKPDKTPSLWHSPEEAALSAELRGLFLSRCAKALREPLTGPRLRAVWLAIFDGWSSREAASAVGGSLTASQIDSIICRLKRRLAAEGLHLPRRSPA